MFDYTRAAGRKIKKDIDNLSLGLSIVTQLFSILYLIYILFFGSGNLAVKICLLVLSVGYFLFFCIATAYSFKKALRRKIKLSVQWSRRLIKIVNLGIIIYGFANAEHTSFSLILIAFSILSWALDLIIGIISFIMTAWLQLFFTGVETDLEEFKQSITAPFTATGNFFKRMTGREVVVEEKPEPNERQRLLNEMVFAEREAKANAKEQSRLERAEKKLQAKLDKKTEKQERKEEKKEAKYAKKQAKKRAKTPSSPNAKENEEN